MFTHLIKKYTDEIRGKDDFEIFLKKSLKSVDSFLNQD